MTGETRDEICSRSTSSKPDSERVDITTSLDMRRIKTVQLDIQFSNESKVTVKYNCMYFIQHLLSEFKPLMKVNKVFFGVYFYIFQYMSS